jgi:hypothetical protein
MQGKGLYFNQVQRGSKCRCMPQGQSHHKKKYENSSANYTWRPKGAGAVGSMRSITASSGLSTSSGEEYASTLENRKKKVIGEPNEGKPHVRFEVAGDGNQTKWWY